MLKSVKSKAEERYAASQKKYKQALTEKEKARQKEMEHTASLRALRLAKEAADKVAAAKKEATKNKKPSRLPQAHRHASYRPQRPYWNPTSRNPHPPPPLRGACSTPTPDEGAYQNGAP